MLNSLFYLLQNTEKEKSQELLREFAYIFFIIFSEKSSLVLLCSTQFQIEFRKSFLETGYFTEYSSEKRKH